ncbi:MAG: zinc ribbon domain-containing protein [Candidatus Hermodarchaeia archaeon]|jgi:hypothetical protein
MGDVNTASTLVLVAAILQFIMSILSIISGMFFVLMFMGLMFDPFMMGLMGPFLFLTLGVNVVMGIIGLIFGILWLNWRHFPSEHKTGLIVSGILGLLFAGFLPGLLALIAGGITPSPSELPSYQPVKAEPYRAATGCPSCGANITGDDKFCWRCGAGL